MICPRHGRKLASKSNSSKTGSSSSPEICPDCIAEHDILMREHDAKYGLPNACGRDETTSVGPSSTITERGTPSVESNGSRLNSLVGTADDHDMVYLPGASIGDPVSDYDSPRILAADLGSMLDAIIIQHSGALDKVITNLRGGITGPEQVQKIAADLSSVAESVGALPFAEISKAPTLNDSSRKRTLVLDLDPATLRRRTQSIPQLLDIIDAVAQDFGLSLATPLPAVGDAKEATLVDDSRYDSEPSESEAKPTELTGPSDSSLSDSSISNMALSPDSTTAPPSDSSVSNMALPPDGTIAPPPTSQDVEPETSSSVVPPLPDSIAAPPFMSQSSGPEYSALIVPSPPDNITALPSPVSPGKAPSVATTRLPSEVLRSQDFAPLPPPELKPAHSGSAQSLSLLQPGSGGGNPSPAMQSPSYTPVRTRSLLSPVTAPDPRLSSFNVAPYQGKPGEARALVKPSEVKKKDQQQRTFEQAWLKDASRASSQKERDERKGRMTTFGRDGAA